MGCSEPQKKNRKWLYKSLFCFLVVSKLLFHNTPSQSRGRYCTCPNYGYKDGDVSLNQEVRGTAFPKAIKLPKSFVYNARLQHM